MLITLIKNDLLINFTLPSKVTGSYFITDKVATPEGIKIGSTVDELVQALGDNYDEFNGTYTFTGQGVYITIQTKKNVVTSIEYIMITN